MHDALLSSFTLGDLSLPNRLAMAPLTRSRAGIDGVPSPIMATYYKQRAGAGLIISEACNISRQGTGYPYTPGIYSSEQIEAWKAVTEAVHGSNGRIFLQLWHVGRHSHPWYQPGNSQPVSASALKEKGSIKTPEGIMDTVLPRSLEIPEIRDIVNDYGQAAENAMLAGFDGVEIHGANGYLIDQFIQDGTNKRRDQYGGSVQKRSRFLFEVLEEVVARIGGHRTALRLSPAGIKLDMSDSDPVATFSYIANRLNDQRIAYLHILEPLQDVSHLPHYPRQVTAFIRNIYKGVLMTNGGFDAESGDRAIREGHADLIAYGRPFISNPTLAEKFRTGIEPAPWDSSTFYTQGEKGYTDYV